MEKILIVEDSVEVSRNLTDLLTLNGYFVVTAENGRLGYEQAKEFLPDLIISDIMMPETDGYKLLDLVRNDHSINSTPFIFLSAKSSYENLRKGMGLGADDYIAKPYKVRDMITSVRKAIDKKKKLDKKLDVLKNNIAMSIPHELRTPLTGILGFSSLLKDELELSNVSDEAKEMLYNIESGALRLTNVINKFICYTDTMIMANDPSKLFTLKKKVLPSTSESIMQSSINLEKKYLRTDDIDLELKDVKLFFDESLFQFMVNELIENAFKYSQPNSKVSVSSEIQGENFVITVLDKGIGINKNYINLFSAFTQFDRDKHEIGGSGLGIATIMNILKIYDGKMEIESEEFNFTKVEITIPLPKDDNQIQLFN